MKRAELIRIIERMGRVLIRHGGKHDWYQNPETKVSQPVPRHRQIAVTAWQSISLGCSDVIKL